MSWGILGVCIIFASAWTITIQVCWLKGVGSWDPGQYQWTNRTSGGDQLYFNDPEGILVQLAQHRFLN